MTTATDADGLTQPLRELLMEWQRNDLAQAAAKRRLLGLPPVMTEAEWQRRAVKRDRVDGGEGREEARG